jgi:diguanylate cyclase (GGDEF)-like protein/PAS domain S-box-containing protein
LWYNNFNKINNAFLKENYVNLHKYWIFSSSLLKNTKLTLVLLFVFACGLLLSGLVLKLSMQVETGETHEDFSLASEDRVSAIERAIESKFRIVESMQSFFVATDEVHRDEFREFVQPFLRAEPGIQALEWIPKVNLEDRNRYETRARDEGFPDFKFTERHHQGHMVGARARNEYFPVYFVEPGKGNEAAFGFDLASNAARFNALQHSRRTGKIVATAPITLVQEMEQKQGFLCFLPVYDSDTLSENSVESEKELRGFVLGVFRIGDLVDSALSYLQPQAIELAVADVSNTLHPESVYQDSLSETGRGVINDTKSTSNKFTQEYEMDIGGRTWSVTTRASREFVEARTTFAPWFFFGLSLTLTGFLTLTIYKILSTNIAISRKVSERTRELRERKQQLKDSEQMLRAIIENASDVIFTLTSDGTATYVSPEVRNLMGYESNELLGKNCGSIVLPEDIPICQSAMEEMVNSGESVFTVEYRALRKDGSTRWHCTKGSAIRNGDGEITSVVCVARDITDSRRREDELKLVASHDSLTGLINRGRFDIRFDEEWRRAVRDGSPISLALIDVDHFKAFNDNYGHQAGDECLKRIASVLGKPLKRPADFIARYGGEEFVAVLPATDQEGAQIVCEQIRAEVTGLNIEHSHSTTAATVSASIGISSVRPTRLLAPAELIAAADRALYKAKETGRNRVQFGDAPSLAAESTL